MLPQLNASFIISFIWFVNVLLQCIIWNITACMTAKRPSFLFYSPFFHLAHVPFQVAILSELTLSKRASERLLTMYFPFLGFAILAILRGLTSHSGKTMTIGKRLVLNRKKRAWSLTVVHWAAESILLSLIPEDVPFLLCSWIIFGFVI